MITWWLTQLTCHICVIWTKYQQASVHALIHHLIISSIWLRNETKFGLENHKNIPGDENNSYDLLKSAVNISSRKVLRYCARNLIWLEIRGDLAHIHHNWSSRVASKANSSELRNLLVLVEARAKKFLVRIIIEISSYKHTFDHFCMWFMACKYK